MTNGFRASAADAPSIDPGGEARADGGVLHGLVGYHLRRAASVFAADFTRALAGTGIRQVLFGIMSIIAEEPGIRQGAIGRRLGIQRANMVALVGELVDAGLVERSVPHDDRRALSLVLTRRGEEMVMLCLDRIRRHEDHLLAGLGDDQREQLIAALRAIGTRP